MPTLTKCARDGCEAQTANTFCSRECNRLSHCGPGTRAAKPQTRSGIVLERHQGDGRRLVVARGSEASDPASSCGDWRKLRAYCKEHDAPKDNSNARCFANIRKRNEDRKALTERRRASRKKRNA